MIKIKKGVATIKTLQRFSIIMDVTILIEGVGIIENGEFRAENQKDRQ